MTIDLSILICSLLERQNVFLDKLLAILNPQLRNNVEVLIISDNAKRTIGEKRNDLLKLAKGKYIVYVDDDDRLSANFVEQILTMVHIDADVINYLVEITFDGERPKLVKYSKNYGHYEAPDAYYRLPNSRMVHKRSNCTELFQEVNFGEDDEWAARMLPLIKTEAQIDKILYYYDYSTTTKKY